MKNEKIILSQNFYPYLVWTNDCQILSLRVSQFLAKLPQIGNIFGNLGRETGHTEFDIVYVFAIKK